MTTRNSRPVLQQKNRHGPLSTPAKVELRQSGHTHSRCTWSPHCVRVPKTTPSVSIAIIFFRTCGRGARTRISGAIVPASHPKCHRSSCSGRDSEHPRTQVWARMRRKPADNQAHSESKAARRQRGDAEAQRKLCLSRCSGASFPCASCLSAHRRHLGCEDVFRHERQPSGRPSGCRGLLSGRVARCRQA